MMWLFAVLVVLVMGGVALVASGRGGSMAPAYDDRPDLALPEDRPISTIGNDVTFWVCTSVSASNSSSKVPKPPGSTTKPWAYFTNIVLRAKK